MPKSKLILGTAQLGMEYGLTNKTGQPTRDESFAILDAARDGGIELFDTACTYGSAEVVLGQWIEARSLQSSVRIISKLKPDALNDYPDGSKVSDIVRREIERSLDRLHISCLDGYLLHSPHYLYLSHVIAALQMAKKEGLVKCIGVSTYDEDEALYAIELGLDYIQVPYNLFDRRLDKVGFFERAHDKGIKVFARSPFLQGLLLIQLDALPARLEGARSYIMQFSEVAQRHHMTRTEAALAFVESHRGVDSVVVGVDSLAQLRELLAVEKKVASLGTDFMADVSNQFFTIEREIVNPSLWNRK